MTGSRAYALYCESYNDCAPPDLPRFASESVFLDHAASIRQNRSLPQTGERLKSFLQEYSAQNLEGTQKSLNEESGSRKTGQQTLTSHAKIGKKHCRAI